MTSRPFRIAEISEYALSSAEELLAEAIKFPDNKDHARRYCYMEKAHRVINSAIHDIKKIKDTK